MSEGTSHRPCRRTKCQDEPNFSWAITDDALYKMTTPKAAMPIVVPKSIQSVLSLCAILVSGLQLLYEGFENVAAMLVARELIEAGAGRGQQDGIAGLRVGICEADGLFQGAGLLQRERAAQLFADLGGGRADQQGGVRLRGERCSQDRIVQAFVLAAQNHPKATGKSVQGLEGGIHAGG